MNAVFMIRSAIVILWMASMGALLRYEAYPEWFTKTIPGYKGLISDTLLARESWSRILIGGIPAGYSHTTLGVNDETPEHLLEINNRVHLRIQLLGQEQRILAQTDVSLDRDYGLVAFNASVSAGPLSMRAGGRRIRGRQFEITTTTGPTSMVRLLDIPAEAFLYSPVQELALRDLRPGNRLFLKTINPMTMQSTSVQIEAIARETITVDGKSIDTTRLESSWQGMRFPSWVNADGAVVRQETPLGWIIEACSAEAALDSVSGDHKAPSPFGDKGGGMAFNLLFGKAHKAP